MKTAVLAAALLLLFSSLHADFFANYDAGSGKVWVLCENQSSVFVSAQGQGARELALDAASQVSFIPQQGEKYAVQCGKSTLVISVPSEPQSPQPVQGGGEIYLLALAALFAVFSIGVFIFALRVLFSQSWFCKSVEGGTTKISLRAGAEMKNREIRDPVAMGFSGKEMEFHIPRLGAGKEWQAEYGTGEPQGALPASLQAECKGKKISMLSQLIADFPAKKKHAASAKAQPKAKRKVRKAED